jgi:hypothetical protein
MMNACPVREGKAASVTPHNCMHRRVVAEPAVIRAVLRISKFSGAGSLIRDRGDFSSIYRWGFISTVLGGSQSIF